MIPSKVSVEWPLEDFKTRERGKDEGIDVLTCAGEGGVGGAQYRSGERGEKIDYTFSRRQRDYWGVAGGGGAKKGVKFYGGYRSAIGMGEDMAD